MYFDTFTKVVFPDPAIPITIIQIFYWFYGIYYSMFNFSNIYKIIINFEYLI
jgi:hypothetical protein